MLNNKEYSPFTPGSPAPLDLFVGRSNQIQEVVRYIKQTLSGRQENFFLSGDRGIGKSSFAAFIRTLIANQQDILGIHVFLGQVSTLEGLVSHIFDELLKETRQQKWFNNIAHFFGKYIQEVGLFGVSVSFSPPKDDLSKLVASFPIALHNLVKKITDEKKGIFIALDDINGLADKANFANWYKSFVDHVATHYKNFPVSIMLIGVPERRDHLATLQPSLMRIFRVVEIEKLSDHEVESFIINAFKNADMKLNQEAIKLIVKYSSGFPILMQEIGDAIFWLDTDGVVDKHDAMEGILIAAERIGRKYLDPKVYRAIRSENYRSILRKLAKTPLSRNFSRADVESKLNENEQKVFHNFLKRLRDLGIIESNLEQGRGSYRFVNEIYPIYMRIESERVK
jgi:hypothetical protein